MHSTASGSQASSDPLARAGSTHTGSKSDSVEGGSPVLRENVAAATEVLNTRLEGWNTNLRFKINEDDSRVIVEVVDVESGDVVRQIPTEEVLYMSKELDRLRDLAFKAQA